MAQAGASSKTVDFGAFGTQTIFSLNLPAGGSGSSASAPTNYVPAVPTANDALEETSAPAASVFHDLSFSTTIGSQSPTSVVGQPKLVDGAANDAARLLLVGAVDSRVSDSDEASYAVATKSDSEGDECLDLALAAAFGSDTDWRCSL